MKKRSFFYAALLLSLQSFTVFSQQTANLKDIYHTFRGEVFEAYLDRADRAESREEWLSVAEYGAEAVIAKWEQEVLLLMGGDFNITLYKAELENRIREELEQRLSEWLVKSFFYKLETPDYSPFFTAISEQNRTYLYEVDPVSGEVKRDGAGDPVFKKGDPSTTEELKQWRGAVEGSIEAVLEEWSTRALSANAELLALIPEGKTEYFTAAFTAHFSLYKTGLRREMDVVFQQEENRFISKRMRDQFSLRKKSEEETAVEVVKELIVRTETEIGEGIYNLMLGLHTAKGDAGAGDVSINADAWQESFKREFEKGLSKWNRAEESLLVERLEWERQAGRDFKEGEKAWALAYGKLQEARRTWEAKIGKILEEGAVQWRGKEEELSTSIERARQELSQAVKDRQGSLSARVENLVDLYTQSVNMMNTAYSSVDFWAKKLKEKSYISEDELNSLKLDSPIYNQITDRMNSRGGEPANIAAELRFWDGVWKQYQGYMHEAEENLSATYGIILSEISIESPPGSGIIRPPVYKEAVEGDTWERVHLDTYQVEVLKARAVEKYWAGQLAIAQRLSDYANDTSSGRMTDAESEKAYEAALAAYAEAKKAYDTAVTALEETGGRLSASKQDIDTLRVELIQKKKEIEEAESMYQSMLDLLKSQNTEYFKDKLKNYYKELLEIYGFKAAGTDRKTLAGVMADYLGAAKKYGLEKNISLTSREVKQLIEGDEGSSQGQKSLQSLHARAEKCRSWTFSKDEWAFKASLEDGLELNRSDYYYSLLAGEWEMWNKAGDMSSEKIVSLIRIETLVASVTTQAELEVEERLGALTFLASKTLSDWTGTFGAITNGTGSGFPSVKAVMDFFEKRKGKAAADYYLALAEGQKRVLNIIAGCLTSSRDLDNLKARVSSSSGSEEEKLAYVFLSARLDQDNIALQAMVNGTGTALEKVIEVLSAISVSDNPGLPENMGVVHELADGYPYLKDFFSGTGFLTLSGSGNEDSRIQMDRLLPLNAWKEKERWKTRLALLDRYAGVAPSLIALREDTCLKELTAFFASKGLTKVSPPDDFSTLSLKNPSDVWKGAKGSSLDEKLYWFAELRQGVDRITAEASPALTSCVEDYIAKLSEYAALEAAAAGASAETLVPSADGRLQAEKEWTETLAKTVQWISGDAGELSKLFSLYGFAKENGGKPESVQAADVEERIVKTAGLKLANKVYSMQAPNTPPENIDEGIWNETLFELLQTYRIESCPEGLKKGIIDQGKAMYLEALLFSGGLKDYDWTRAPENVTTYYRTALFNRFDAGTFFQEGYNGVVAWKHEKADQYKSLSEMIEDRWGETTFDQNGVEGFWIERLYNGFKTSFAFDNIIAAFADRVKSGTFRFSSIDRKLIENFDCDPAALLDFYYADLLKQRLDKGLEQNGFSSGD
ncbi:MAG: hypothetical protein AB1798_09510, partial [Spirochaetota bacterium]